MPNLLSISITGIYVEFDKKGCPGDKPPRNVEFRK